MTPDLLSALRETPGCGEDPECIVRHTLAVHHADECDPCLTRLAEAVIEQVVARMPADRCWRDGSVVSVVGIAVPRATLYHTLLAALRAENERLTGAIRWALGEGDSDFHVHKPSPNPATGRVIPAFWWRTHLRQKAGLAPSGENRSEG